MKSLVSLSLARSWQNTLRCLAIFPIEKRVIEKRVTAFANFVQQYRARAGLSSFPYAIFLPISAPPRNAAHPDHYREHELSI